MRFLFYLWIITAVGFAADGDKVRLETADFSLFPYPGQIKLGKEERIYIADIDASCIRVFDRNAKFLFSIGRSGEAPGEFKRWFGEFEIDAKGTIYQVDNWAGNRWVNIFDADGHFLKNVPLSKFEGVFGPQRVYPFKDQLVVGIENNYRSEKNGPLYFSTDDQTYYRLSMKGEQLAKLFTRKLALEISQFPDREGRPIPHQNALVCGFDAKQGLLAYQVSDEDKCKVLDLNTGKERSFANGFRRRQVTKEDVKSFIEDRLKNVTAPESASYEKQLYAEVAKYADQLLQYQPIVDRMFFNPKGELVISYQNPKTKRFTVHKFTPSGSSLKNFESNFVPEAYASQGLIWLERDEEKGEGFLHLKAPLGNF